MRGATPRTPPEKTRQRLGGLLLPKPDHALTEAGTKRQRARAARFAFTDRAIKAVRVPAGERNVEVWDTHLPGFGLRIWPSGAKTWIFRYRRGAKQRLLKVGKFPGLSLKAARKAARNHNSSVSAGGDPSQGKVEAREAVTFGGLAKVYLEKHASKKRTGDEDARILERDLLPRFRSMHARDVKRADVIALLDEKAEAAPIMSNRVLALLRKLYNFGIERALVESNPCYMVKAQGTERRRERVLTEEEIRGLWLGLDGHVLEGGALRGGGRSKNAAKEDGEGFALVAAVRLLLLTAQRRGEVLAMRWKDIAEEGAADARRLVWTIPAEDAKNGRAHRVPLAPAAEEIVRLLPRTSEWVLPGRIEGAPVTNIERAIDRARERQRLAHFTPHDLRRTAASAMSALGTPRLVLKRVLNHVDRDVTGIYDRHTYDPEKRTALDAWARRVSEIVNGSARGASVLAFAKRG